MMHQKYIDEALRSNISSNIFNYTSFICSMLVKKLKYTDLLMLVGSRCQFKSDCEFFPNFNLIGTIHDVSINNNEYIINIETEPTGKIIPIGSNMRNLTIEKL